MNMLPLLVIFAAIVAFFQDELGGVFRKFFSYPWVRIVLPITVASIGCEMYASKHWMFAVMQSRLHAVMLSFFQCFPYSVWSAIFSQWVFLFVVSGLPAWGLCWWFQRKEVVNIGLKITYIYLLVWLVLILLWVV